MLETQETGGPAGINAQPGRETKPMLKKLVIGLAVTAFVVLLAGAVTLGVIAYRLDARLAAAQADLQTLREAHAALQEQRDQLEGDLAHSAETVKSQQETLMEMQESIDEAGARIRILNLMFVPLVTDEADALSEDELVDLFLEWTVSIKQVGDPVLEDKFEDMFRRQDEASLNDFLVYLLTSAEDSLK